MICLGFSGVAASTFKCIAKGKQVSESTYNRHKNLRDTQRHEQFMQDLASMTGDHEIPEKNQTHSHQKHRAEN